MKKEMKISVSDETKKFFLAFEEWREGVGHEISVGKYRFSAVPTSGGIIISEVTSGAKFMNLPLNPYVMLRTSTKEDAVEYLSEVGEGLRKLLLSVSTSELDKKIEKTRIDSIQKLGPMPKIEKFDSSWMFEESKGTH